MLWLAYVLQWGIRACFYRSIFRLAWLKCVNNAIIVIYPGQQTIHDLVPMRLGIKITDATLNDVVC